MNADARDASIDSGPSCVSGSDCVYVADPCHKGTTSCAGGSPVCQATTALSPDGTNCGIPNQYCVVGECKAATQTLSVLSGDFQLGLVDQALGDRRIGEARRCAGCARCRRHPAGRALFRCSGQHLWCHQRQRTSNTHLTPWARGQRLHLPGHIATLEPGRRHRHGDIARGQHHLHRSECDQQQRDSYQGPGPPASSTTVRRALPRNPTARFTSRRIAW